MENLSSLVKKRGIIKGQLTRFQNYLDSISNLSNPDSTVLSQLEIRVSAVQPLLEEFNVIQYEIDSTESRADEIAGNLKERENFETLYFQNLGAARTIINKTGSAQANSAQICNSSFESSVQQNKIKLPTINLPTFSGNVENWLEFRDIFNSLIDNNQAMGDVQKFHYLRASLKGEAGQIIQSLEICDSNYAVAWNSLLERYNNKRLIVHSHIKSLFNLPSLTKESCILLRQLHDDFFKHVRSLKTLGQPVEHWDTLLIYLVTNKFDPLSKREWESYIGKIEGEFPTMETLKVFLKGKCETLNVCNSETKNKQNTQKPQGCFSNSLVSTNLDSRKQLSCAFCRKGHSIYQCEEFKALSVASRISEVKGKKLCFNCLRYSHQVRDCKSHNCKICKRKHNILLHMNGSGTQSSSEQNTNENVTNSIQVLEPTSEEPTATSIVSNHIINHYSQILLSTAIVKVRGEGKDFHQCRALLDCGSQSNFIAEELVDKLKLSKNKINLNVIGINHIATNMSHSVEIEFHSLFKNCQYKVSCIVVPQITGNIPNSSFELAKLNIPSNIQLADKTLNKAAKIDLLVGAELFYSLLCIGQINLNKGNLVLQKTTIGWVLGGPLQGNNKVVCNLTKTSSNDQELHNQLIAFRNIEECPKGSVFSQEEKLCEQRFKQYTTRQAAGRFVVAIPSKESTEKLGGSSDSAIKRFYSLERRLVKNQNLMQQLWQYKLSWDESIPAKLHTQWYQLFQNELNALRLSKLQRCVAYCLRFKYNASCPKRDRRSVNLSTEELQNSLETFVKVAQSETFAREISDLNKNKRVNSKSRLLALDLFLDDKGIIRVGGRLSNSEFSQNKRHPYLLPPKHELTKLIVQYEHVRMLHSGPQALLAGIRELYWPISGRNVVKSVVRNCVTCFRAKPRCIEQLMGSLPKDRVTPTFPFSVCGVDYCGPITIKNRKGRGCKSVKAYICIFICFAVKAIHIELVSDLTTEAFIAAMRRFVARRGKPAKIFSDNAKNFVGADAEFKRFIRSLAVASKKDVGATLESDLKRVIGNAMLTFEELNSVLIQIEAVVNSRPLTPLSSDPNDLNPLTPAHFLIGRSFLSLPDQDLTTIKESRLSRFQHCQRLVQHFWNRWSKEYIGELQKRTKWKNNDQPAIIEGTMVLISEEGVPPLKWKLGRVIKTYPGGDSVVRVVSVKTGTGTYKRAVAKLCALPVDNV